jgi:hypothetical protein
MVETALALPTHLPPAIDMFLGQDGTAWINRDLRSTNPVWLVVGPDGTAIREVTTPPGVKLQAANGRTIWGTMTDELGAHVVVRLEILPR